MAVSGKPPPGGSDNRSSKDSSQRPSKEPKTPRPGRDAPIWDDPAFLELAICLGVRPAPGPEASLPRPSRLDPIQVVPTDRFRNRYFSLRESLGLPGLDGVEMTRSVEVTRVWHQGEWVEQRTPGVWRP